MSMNKFFKLIQANKDKPRNIPHKIQTEQEDDGAVKNEAVIVDNSATMYVYGVIISDEYWQFSDYDIVAQQFVKEVRSLDANPSINELNVRIDSVGGEVFAARTMASAIKDFKGTVNIFIDGLAASSASFLAMSGDNVTMAEGAMIMIHNAWMCSCGNASDLLKSSVLLNQLDGTIASTYAKKTGMDEEKLLNMMNEETWITAKEAVEMGFADSLSDSSAVENGWDLSAYNNAPNPNLPKDENPVNNNYPEPVEPPVDDPVDDTNNERYAHNQRYASYLESFV